MVKLTSKAEMRAARRQAGTRTVGLVPTMGALHAGHCSLIERARADCEVVVVSIFVNPTQFGSGEDLQGYPRSLEQDLRACDELGVDIVYAPSIEEVYPRPSLTRVETQGLSTGLCGRDRPGHFAGVCLVVAKLFNLIRPCRAYFGHKDAQQAAIVRRMAEDLDFEIEIVVCPTVREADGLAMSSRNVYLTPEQRRQAAGLYRCLEAMRRAVQSGETDRAALLRAGRRILESAGPCKIGYVDLVDPQTLESLQDVQGPALAAVAVTIGDCRLIDNLLIDEVPPKP